MVIATPMLKGLPVDIDRFKKETPSFDLVSVLFAVEYLIFLTLRTKTILNLNETPQAARSRSPFPVQSRDLKSNVIDHIAKLQT